MDFYLSNEKVLALLNCWNQNHVIRASRQTPRVRETDKKKSWDPPSIEPNANKKCNFDCFIFNIDVFFSLFHRFVACATILSIFSPSNNCEWWSNESIFGCYMSPHGFFAISYNMRMDWAVYRIGGYFFWESGRNEECALHILLLKLTYHFFSLVYMIFLLMFVL